MIFENHELMAIAERAVSIRQRMGEVYAAVDDEDGQARAERRLANWKVILGEDGPLRLEKRLRWDDLDAEAVRQAIGKVYWRVRRRLPEWCRTLNEILGEIASSDVSDLLVGETRPAFLNAQPPFPFQEAMAPFIAVAERRLRAAVGENYDLLSAEARVDLQHGLLQRLVELCAPTLYLEYTIRRSIPGTPKQMERITGFPSGQRFYFDFVQFLFAEKWRAIFIEYAVLARLAATLIEFWVTNTAEMIERLAADWDQLEQVFEIPAKQNSIIQAVETNLSDPHQQGRMVHILTWVNGAKIVYKPRPVILASAFFALVAWLNGEGLPHPLHVLKVLDRTQYGWVQFIEQAACATTDALERYYQRAGMLLCLLYVLEGSDCHAGNLIAAGEYPVLIDLETLFHPRMRLATTNIPNTLAEQQYLDSILRTGLLPLRFTEEHSFEVGALGAISEQTIPLQQAHWDDVNGDQMRMRRASSVSVRPHCVARLNSEAAAAHDYLSAIMTGFEEMYNLLLSRRKGVAVLLSHFAQGHPRFLFRNTSQYAALLAQLSAPEYLRDGVERDLALEVLGVDMLGERERPAHWVLFAAEKEALDQLDIPWFTAVDTQQIIHSGTRQLQATFFDAPAYEIVHERLQTLDQNDLAKQLGIIRATFALRSESITDED